MKKTILVTSIALATSPLCVFAEAPSYSYIAAGYVESEADEKKFSGASVIVSYELSENLFIKGKYAKRDGSFDTVVSTPLGDAPTELDIEIKGMTLGLGFKSALSDHSSAYALVSYIEGEQTIEAVVDVPSRGKVKNDVKIEDNGYFIEVGVRAFVFENFEVSPFVKHKEIYGDNETSAGIYGSYFFTDSLALSVAYEAMSGGDNLILGGLRYNF